MGKQDHIDRLLLIDLMVLIMDYVFLFIFRESFVEIFIAIFVLALVIVLYAGTVRYYDSMTALRLMEQDESLFWEAAKNLSGDKGYARLPDIVDEAERIKEKRQAQLKEMYPSN